MTDRIEFLYLRKEFTETLSEKWEESQASSSSGQPTAPCGSTPATPAKMSRKRSVDSDSFGPVFKAQLFVFFFFFCLFLSLAQAL